MIGALLAVDDLDRDGLGIVDERLGDVFDQVGGCHRRAPTCCRRDDAGLLEQAADGVGRLGALGEPVLGLGLVDAQLDRVGPRVVVPDRVDRAPVAGGSAVGDDEPVASAAWSRRRGSGGCGRPWGGCSSWWLAGPGQADVGRRWGAWAGLSSRSTLRTSAPSSVVTGDVVAMTLSKASRYGLRSDSYSALSSADMQRLGELADARDVDPDRAPCGSCPTRSSASAKRAVVASDAPPAGRRARPSRSRARAEHDDRRRSPRTRA